MKTDKELVYVPIEFEHFLSFLFGKQAYHGFVGTHSLSSWKKELVKIIRVVRRAIRVNVNTDTFHREDLTRRCDSAIENIQRASTVDEVNAVALRCSFTLNFMLLGQFPSHWDKSNVSNAAQWKLDEFRKLAYIRNVEHKANLIMSLPNKHGFCDRVPEWGELWNKRFREFKGDAEGFVQWFKTNHTDVYLELD